MSLPVGSVNTPWYRPPHTFGSRVANRGPQVGVDLWSPTTSGQPAAGELAQEEVDAVGARQLAASSQNEPWEQV